MTYRFREWSADKERERESGACRPALVVLAVVPLCPFLGGTGDMNLLGDGRPRSDGLQHQPNSLLAPVVAMPGAPSSVLAPSSKARSP